MARNRTLRNYKGTKGTAINGHRNKITLFSVARSTSELQVSRKSCPLGEAVWQPRRQPGPPAYSRKAVPLMLLPQRKLWSKSSPFQSWSRGSQILPRKTSAWRTTGATCKFTDRYPLVSNLSILMPRRALDRDRDERVIFTGAPMRASGDTGQLWHETSQERCPASTPHYKAHMGKDALPPAFILDPESVTFYVRA
jgi:hypothetical protein